PRARSRAGPRPGCRRIRGVRRRSSVVEPEGGGAEEVVQQGDEGGEEDDGDEDDDRVAANLVPAGPDDLAQLAADLPQELAEGGPLLLGLGRRRGARGADRRALRVDGAHPLQG